MAESILFEEDRPRKGRESQIAYLTLETFIRLDAAARAKAGLAVHVSEADKLGMNFAVLPVTSLDHYPDARMTRGVGCKQEKPGFLLANKVDLRSFWETPRLELDYSAVPAELVYDFLVWHEIGHRVRKPDMFQAFLHHGCRPGTYKGRLTYYLTERRADRYAWEVIMPDHKPPVKEGQRPDFPSLQEMDDFQAAHPELFDGPDLNPRPVSSAPWYMVPARHIDQGIPWAWSD